MARRRPIASPVPPRARVLACLEDGPADVRLLADVARLGHAEAHALLRELRVEGLVEQASAGWQLTTMRLRLRVVGGRFPSRMVPRLGETRDECAHYADCTHPYAQRDARACSCPPGCDAFALLQVGATRGSPLGRHV